MFKICNHHFTKLPELLRFIYIGILNNLWGYLIYLILTFWGLSPKTVLVVFYPIGIFIAYRSHKRHSFGFHENSFLVKIKFLTVYLLGFFLNLSILNLLYKKMGYSHQIIQGISIGIVALFNYFLLKNFVFYSNVCPIKNTDMEI